MSEPLSAAEEAGKDTRGATPSHEGASTRPVMPAWMPHLPYAEAVYTRLAAEDLRPPLVEVGVSGLVHRRLTLRLSWPRGHRILGAGLREQLLLTWSQDLGWSVRTLLSSTPLMIDVLAAPAVVADVVRHLAEHGPESDPPALDALARWEHALPLDAALADFDDREVFG